MEHELIDEIEQQSAKRRIFLTVLCILTWIGAAGIVVFNAYGFLHFLRMQDVFGAVPQIKLMLWTTLINCCGSLISAAGAIYLWRHKRFGYYVYLVGQLVPLMLSAWALVQAKRNILEAPVGVLVVFAFWFIVPLIFLVLYAAQLKYIARRH